MGVKNGVDYTSDEILKEIYTGAMEVFGGVIVVPSEYHPCGWDWIDFSNIEDILVDCFDICDISKGIYDDHAYADLTLKEILNKTKGKFLFEINCNVNWEE